jgi:hypothetical protein
MKGGLRGSGGYRCQTQHRTRAMAHRRSLLRPSLHNRLHMKKHLQNMQPEAYYSDLPLFAGTTGPSFLDSSPRSGSIARACSAHQRTISIRRFHEMIDESRLEELGNDWRDVCAFARAWHRSCAPGRQTSNERASNTWNFAQPEAMLPHRRRATFASERRGQGGQYAPCAALPTARGGVIVQVGAACG